MEGVGPRLERVCPNCGGKDMVEVHSEGDIVCKVRAVRVSRAARAVGAQGAGSLAAALATAAAAAAAALCPCLRCFFVTAAATAVAHPQFQPPPHPAPQGCGLVVEAHIIDERSEWRTFGDKDKEGDDPSRVGGATNLLLDDGGLGTTIGRVQGDGGASFALSKMHMRQNNQMRHLKSAFAGIGEMCSKLNQSDAVKNTACEIYKNVHDNKALRGRKSDLINAACLLVASRQVRGLGSGSGGGVRGEEGGVDVWGWCFQLGTLVASTDLDSQGCTPPPAPNAPPTRSTTPSSLRSSAPYSATTCRPAPR